MSTAEERCREAQEKYTYIAEHLEKVSLWEDAAENVYVNCTSLSGDEGLRAQKAWHEAIYVLDEWVSLEIKAYAVLVEAKRILATGMDVEPVLSGGAL